MKEVISYVFSNCRKTKRVQSDCRSDRGIKKRRRPSVSKAIAEVIGASKKEEGYLEGKGCIVSWCFGHLAEYVPPDSYDERFTRWLYEDLPIIPEEWKLAVSKDKKEQFYILKNWQYPKIRKNSSIF